MTITIKISGIPQEVELSDEQIIAIGQKYFSLRNQEVELKPINTDFGVMEQPDKISLAYFGDIKTGTTRGNKRGEKDV